MVIHTYRNFMSCFRVNFNVEKVKQVEVEGIPVKNGMVTVTCKENMRLYVRLFNGTAYPYDIKLNSMETGLPVVSIYTEGGLKITSKENMRRPGSAYFQYSCRYHSVKSAVE